MTVSYGVRTMSESEEEGVFSFLDYWLLEDGPQKDEARRLYALELCRLDTAVVCEGWAAIAPAIEQYLKDGKITRLTSVKK